MGTFANELERLRKARQLTQDELAKRAGISQGAICQYENGAIMPKAEIALKLAECLGTTVENLLKGGESNGKAETDDSED